MSKRVLFVIGSLHKGGAETQLLLLAEKLKEENIIVDLYVLECTGELLTKAQSIFHNIFSGGFDSREPKIKKVIILLKNLFNIRSVLTSNNYNAIHSFLPLANVLASISSIFIPGLKVITSRRALNTHQDRVKMWKYLDILSTILSDSVVCNAKMVKQDCIHREGNSKKYKVIYNLCKNINEYSQGENHLISKNINEIDDLIKFVMVSNIIPYKGHEVVIRAIPLLNEDLRTRIKILFVGDDRGIGKSLQHISATLNVSEHILWLGARNDVYSILGNADVYISASFEEGTSNSIIEALQSNLPVIATNVGGTPELLDGIKSKILIKKNNSQELADAITLMFLEISRFKEEAKESSLIIESKFNSKNIVNKYKELYGVC